VGQAFGFGRADGQRSYAASDDGDERRHGDEHANTLRSGPNSFGNNLVTHVPGPGHRFLWAHLHLTNETKQDRRFSWSACDLDDGNDAILPGVVAVDSAVVNPRQMNEIIEAKDTVNRKVAFSYPYDRLPTRLKCKEMVFPLDL
jgi:hypothetical protein